MRILLFVALLFMSTVGLSEAKLETLSRVADFLKTNLEGKEFETSGSEDPAIDNESGKSFIANFTRLAKFENFKVGERTLTFEYRVKMIWDFFEVNEKNEVIGENLFEPEEYESVFRFEVQAYQENGEALYGFAHVVKSLDNGKEEDVAGVAYRVRLALEPDESLSIQAKMMFPTVIDMENPGDVEGLRFENFSEVMTPQPDGTLARKQTFTSYKVEQGTMTRVKPAESSFTIEETSLN